jgi:hypothetical protein
VAQLAQYHQCVACIAATPNCLRERTDLAIFRRVTFNLIDNIERGDTHCKNVCHGASSLARISHSLNHKGHQYPKVIFVPFVVRNAG